MSSEILRAISDDDSLKIFDFIATEKEKKIDTHTLQNLNGLSQKQYYMRLHNLKSCGLVKRTLGAYQLTPFGKIIYSIKLRIDSAVKDYWAIAAIDTFGVTRDTEVRKKLINTVIRDTLIQEILLEED